MQTKRVTFRGSWLAYALVLPQLAVTAVFFLWPAGEALYQSVLQEDAFGLSTKFVGLANFKALVHDPSYLNSFGVTVVFSASTTILAMTFALLFAAMADYVIRGASGYKTLLIMPYAVAPALAGVLWWFLFNPTIGIIAYVLHQMGIPWNHLRQRHGRADPDHRRLGVEAGLLQFHLLPRRNAGDSALPHRGSGDRRLGAGQALPHHHLPAARADQLLPAGRQHSLRLLRNLFGGSRHDPGRARRISTQILVYKVWHDAFISLDLGGSAAQSVILMIIVVGLTVVQFRYIERRVEY